MFYNVSAVPQRESASHIPFLLSLPRCPGSSEHAAELLVLYSSFPLGGWVGAGVCVSTLVSQFLIVYSLCEPPALLRFKGGVCFSPGPINRDQATKKLFLPPADDDVIIKRAGESGSGQEQNH